MQAQTIINQVRRELVETVGSFWSDAEILDLINRAERDLNNKIRILEDRAQITLVIGQKNYPLPLNWISARALFLNNEADSVKSWSRLRPSNLEKIAQEKPNFLSTETDTLGVPTEYWIWGREIYFQAAPKSAYTVVMFYKSKPITLTLATQELNIDDSLADGITAYCLWKAWSKEKEFDLAASAQEEYNSFVREGRRFVKKQSGDQKFRLDIESGVPFTGGGLN